MQLYLLANAVVCSVMAAMVFGQEFAKMASMGAPLFTIPVSLQSDLEYYDGLSAEQAADAFMQRHGLKDRRDANLVSKQLTDLVDQALQQRGLGQQPVLSFPITIDDGNTRQFSLLPGQSAEEAVVAFLTSSGLGRQADIQEFGPQLLNLVRSRLAEKQRPQTVNEKPMFSLEISLDNQPRVFAVFHKRSPYSQAREFCVANGITKEDVAQQLIQQLGDLAIGRIKQMRLERSQQQLSRGAQLLLSLPVAIFSGKEDTIYFFANDSAEENIREFMEDYGLISEANAQQMAQQLYDEVVSRLQTRQPKFVLPITIGDNNVDLAYFDGDTPADVARAFLTNLGLIEAPTAQALFEQLINAIETRLQQEGARKPQSQYLFEIPLVINDKSMSLGFTEGRDVETTTEEFMIAHGLDKDANANEYRQQIQLLLSQRLERISAATVERSSQQSPIQADMLQLLSIKIGEKTHQLSYTYNESPEDTAKRFCKENWDDVKANLGDEAQSEHCVALVQKLVAESLSALSAATSEPEAEPSQATKES